MIEENNNNDQGPARYYPTQGEQQYLIMGCRQYFSYPERSSNRNIIASQITTLLKQISPHWTHRAVRLWFNNNKKSVLGEPMSPNGVFDYGKNNSMPQHPNMIQEKSLFPQKVTFPPIRSPVPNKVSFNPEQTKKPKKPIEENKNSNSTSGYSVLNSILNEMQQLHSKGISIDEHIVKFDDESKKISIEYGSCLGENVKIMPRFVYIPKKSQEGLTENISTEFFSGSKNLMFVDHSDSFVRPSTPENDYHFGLWQERPYTQQHVLNYKSVCVSGSIAAYAYEDINSLTQVISYCNYHKELNTWSLIKLHINQNVENLHTNDQTLYGVTNDNVLVIPINNGNKTNPIILSKAPKFCLTSLTEKGLIIGYPENANIQIIDKNNAIITVNPPYNGLTSISGIDNMILLAPSDSFAIRGVTYDGKESSSYIGHTNFVRGITPISEHNFATKSDDRTIRVWDYREAFPVINISSNHSSVTNMFGNANHLVLGLDDKAICLLDIRNPIAKPILCLSTEDYTTEALYYNSELDTLAFFGIVSSLPIKDSIVFVDNDGQSKKRVFRKYTNVMNRSMC